MAQNMWNSKKPISYARASRTSMKRHMIRQIVTLEARGDKIPMNKDRVPPRVTA